MAHNIGQFEGRAAMFYSGCRPWHGLGTPVEGEQTAAAAIRLAGLDWEVGLEDVFLHGPTSGPAGRKVEGHKAIIRRDTGDVLNVLSDGFTPVQNHEAFNFFDAVVGEGQAIYHTAGALGRGERVWILAKIPGTIFIDAEDDAQGGIEKYVLLANGHDGSLAFRMMFTPVRVVCQNTLTLALGSTEGLSIRHTEAIDGKIKEARRALGIALKNYDDFEARANRLATTPIGRDTLHSYVEEVFPARKGEKVESVVKRLHTLEAMFEELPTNNIGRIGGTFWAAYNAATEFVDWGGREERAEMTSARLKSSWMGAGASTKSKAFDLAVEMAGVA